VPAATEVEVMPDGMPGSVMGPGMPVEAYPPGMLPPMMPGPQFAPQYGDPMTCGPGPRPDGHGFPVGSPGVPNAPRKRELASLYGGLEFSWLRTQISEDVIGKVSEHYDFSPRFILGFDRSGNLGGRARYWHYNHKVESSSDELRFELDVLDLECTHYFSGRHTALALAAGVRAANFKLTDITDDEADADLFGLTMAADGVTPLCGMNGGQIGWVYGGRVSLLGGDWGGDDTHDFVPGQNRDDNVLVNELYVGLQFDRLLPHANIHARLALEMQNWRSDVLAETADIESVSFIGPGLEFGAEF
jgi:hypothetical protein